MCRSCCSGRSFPTAVPFSAGVLADAQLLPAGRNRAGDRHLNFYETRDNLVPHRPASQHPAGESSRATASQRGSQLTTCANMPSSPFDRRRHTRPHDQIRRSRRSSGIFGMITRPPTAESGCNVFCNRIGDRRHLPQLRRGVPSTNCYRPDILTLVRNNVVHARGVLQSTSLPA